MAWRIRNNGSGPGMRSLDDRNRKAMNHHHRKALHALFSHPVSANIAMKDVESVLQ